MRNLTSSYTGLNGGRVLLLLLLFFIAIYEFISSGFNSFAIICAIPIILVLAIVVFRVQMITFWALIIINYILQWKDAPLPHGIPTSLYNEMLEIILIALAIIDTKEAKFERCGNMMLYALFIWCGFCTIEILNNTCNLGINIAAWFQGVRMLAFQLMYTFIVFTLYVKTPKVLNRYLYVWGILALFAVFWVWKQKYIGFTHIEESWIQGPGRSTHIINGGTLTRYFSIYSDAATFGIGIASTAVAFIIFGITSKINKYKYFYLIVGIGCTWAMFPSGTRTAIACMMAGFIVYVFLSKSFKIAIPFSIIFGILICLLAFTKIGNGNQQIRRMRSAFDKSDASANQRTINQETMRKYMKEAPWGIGLGMYGEQVPANNKYRLMSTIAADSEYVFIWLRTGTIGITVFLISTFIMLTGACWIVFFKIKSPSLRGIGAGFCCAFVSQQLGGYGNQVLMQFPNGVVFYGGLSIVYVLPWIEQEWIEWENKELALIEEKKRLKQEKREKSRVRTWLTWK